MLSFFSILWSFQSTGSRSVFVKQLSSISFFIILIVSGCVDVAENKSTLFSKIDNRKAGIDFINQLDQTEELNTYTFRNFYNGAGVGVGDINNDGLQDIYFCGNTKSNKLYLNKGDFKFEDISTKAGVACDSVWSTGVAMVDINADGLLDIYVCKSGQNQSTNRHNELFINNGDLTFTERSSAYGLDVLGLSIQATFFDYDRDGDLDCYLLNNSFKSVESFEPEKDLRDIPDPNGANMFFRNDDMKFVNVTQESGIYSSQVGFGLGATVSDINQDNWPDLYISNDFFERDYLYLNNQDGTFREVFTEQIKESSMGAMGADIADINNDGHAEIYVTEMTAEHNARLKTKTVFQSWDNYQTNLQNGYYHQFARNTLQLNNQNGTFSEIGRFAGVNHTDWSWGALIFDIDLDGYKDIFVANGIYKDLLDRDYLEFYANPRNVRAVFDQSEQGIISLIDKMPSVKISNYAFINNHNLTFTNQAEQLGLNEPGFSNGTAYSDLDNDGDMDLVINNINMEPFILRNNTEAQMQNNFISISLLGIDKNPQAIGSKVTVFTDSGTHYQELVPIRGFMSTVDTRLNFGLGKVPLIDSIIVNWPNGSNSLVKNITTNQFINIDQSIVESFVAKNKEPEKPYFTTTQESQLPSIAHQENDFDDFLRYPMLFHMRSNEGPKICVGDVDNNGLDDFYMCGAKDAPGALYIQKSNGFEASNITLFYEEKLSEETDCVFFDADLDNDLDLYVTCGSLEFPSSSSALIDKLYLNDGNGNFSKSNQILPSFTFESTSCARPSDFDGDGDLDLFVGVRMKPFNFGIAPGSYLLINDGKGIFTDKTTQMASELKQIGHVTDAVWDDIDGDKDEDLVIVGEWMPITILINNQGHLTSPKDSTGLEFSNGWWKTLTPVDVDLDGDMDFIAGIQGQNMRFSPTKDQPLSMYVNDFDLNGNIDQMITTYDEGIPYPLVMKHELVAHMPSLSSRIQSFEDYKHMTLDSIFSDQILSKSIVHHAYNFQSSLIENHGNGTFAIRPLPTQAQLAPVYAITTCDWNQDQIPDLILGGNQTRSKPEAGANNASYGLLLQGNGDGTFEGINAIKSGICIHGEIRDFDILHVDEEEIIIIAKNNSVLEYLKKNGR